MIVTLSTVGQDLLKIYTSPQFPLQIVPILSLRT